MQFQKTLIVTIASIWGVLIVVRAGRDKMSQLKTALTNCVMDGV